MFNRIKRFLGFDVKPSTIINIQSEVPQVASNKPQAIPAAPKPFESQLQAQVQVKPQPPANPIPFPERKHSYDYDTKVVTDPDEDSGSGIGVLASMVIEEALENLNSQPDTNVADTSTPDTPSFDGFGGGDSGGAGASGDF